MSANERPAETTPARRLRAADVIERYEQTIEALTNRPARGDVSVEFTRNAKGATQIAVKVGAPHGIDRAELTELADAAMGEAVRLYTDACAAFPTESGFVRNEGQSVGDELTRRRGKASDAD